MEGCDPRPIDQRQSGRGRVTEVLEEVLMSTAVAEHHNVWMCVATKTRHLDRLGQLSEFEQGNNTNSEAPQCACVAYLFSQRLALKSKCMALSSRSRPSARYWWMILPVMDSLSGNLMELVSSCSLSSHQFAGHCAC